jgi:short-subunit dehydrogenase
VGLQFLGFLKVFRSSIFVAKSENQLIIVIYCHSLNSLVSFQLMPTRELHDLRILITGASSGIGRALAEAVLAHGARVIVMARRGQVLDDWCAARPNLAERIATFAGDVTRAEDRAGVLRLAVDRWGGLDADSDPAILRRVFEINFFAAVELTRAALPLLRAGKSPLIVNIGSILGHRATPQNSEYCASKFALRGWCESVRPELRRAGIDLLLVSPGTTESDFYANTLSQQKSPPWRSPTAVSATEVARQIVRAMERGSNEVIPSWRGMGLVWANRLIPSVVERFMRKWG